MSEETQTESSAYPKKVALPEDAYPPKVDQYHPHEHIPQRMKRAGIMMAFTIRSRALHQFIADDSGQDLVEYALITALIGLGTIVAMKNLAGSIGTVFGAAGTALTTAV